MKKENRTITSIVHWVVFLYLLVLVIQLTTYKLSYADAEKSQDKPNISSNITWLTFSSTEHSYERSFIKKNEHIPTKAPKPKYDKIFIALADLNDDGVKEIFAYIIDIDGIHYCGQIGCPLNIYGIKSGKLISLLRPEFIHGFPMFIEIDNTGKQNEIGILPSKTQGWHDIVLKGGTVWKWNGKKYGYIGN